AVPAAPPLPPRAMLPDSPAGPPAAAPEPPGSDDAHALAATTHSTATRPARGHLKHITDGRVGRSRTGARAGRTASVSATRPLYGGRRIAMPRLSVAPVQTPIRLRRFALAPLVLAFACASSESGGTHAGSGGSTGGAMGGAGTTGSGGSASAGAGAV